MALHPSILCLFAAHVSGLALSGDPSSNAGAGGDRITVKPKGAALTNAKVRQGNVSGFVYEKRAIIIHIKSQPSIARASEMLHSLSDCAWLDQYIDGGRTKILITYTQAFALEVYHHIKVPEKFVNHTDLVYIQEHLRTSIDETTSPNDRKQEFFTAFQMEDFWSYGMFGMKQLKGMRYVMRLDPEGYFMCNANTIDPFRAMGKGVAYGFYKFKAVRGSKGTPINKLVRRYIRENAVEMPNLDMDASKLEDEFAPAFENTFEILFMPYFTSPVVLNFAKFMSEKNAVVGHKWGSGILRFFQIALFFDGKVRDIFCFKSDIIWTFQESRSGDKPHWCNLPVGDLGTGTLHPHPERDRKGYRPDYKPPDNSKLVPEDYEIPYEPDVEDVADLSGYR